MVAWYERYDPAAAVADLILSLKSNHDQQGQFCGRENDDADAAASETHPSPNEPLPEEPVLPSTTVDDQLGLIHNGVRKEPSFEADRDAADAGQQQQPSIQGAPDIRKFSVLILTEPLLQYFLILLFLFPNICRCMQNFHHFLRALLLRRRPLKVTTWNRNGHRFVIECPP